VPSVPTLIKVGCLRYPVVEDRELALEHYSGMHHAFLQKIRVDPLQGPDHKRVTVLHEVGHAVLRHAGFDQGQLGDGGGDERRKMVEALFEALFPGLVGVLEDNPDLVRYLTRHKATR
jgi:hypothetical protein